MLLYLSVVIFLFSRCTQFSLCNGTARLSWGWKPIHNQWSKGWLSDMGKQKGGCSLNSSRQGSGHRSLRTFISPRRSTGSFQTDGLLPSSSSCYTQSDWELIYWLPLPPPHPPTATYPKFQHRDQVKSWGGGFARVNSKGNFGWGDESVSKPGSVKDLGYLEWAMKVEWPH